MQSTITCPNCKKDIELTEAFKHEFQEQFDKDLETAKKEVEEKLRVKIEEEQTLKLKDSENEKQELKNQNKKLQESLLDLNKSVRDLKTRDEQRELEMQKKLSQEEEKIRIEASKKADEANALKILEKDKQLADTLKELEDAKRKLQQGSQQTQGEAFELAFENILKKEFPNDKILEVGKGVRGGDIIQEVVDRNGNNVGKVLWELKNTKTWSEQWVEKLKIDQRTITAEDAVLITEVLPTDMKSSGAFRNGIWVTKRESVVAIASVLRAKLIQLYYVKSAGKGKDEKMDLLFTYLSGTEFKHRVEAILEAWSGMQEDIEKEKRYFANKWSRDDKHIRQVIDNTLGMRGDLEGIMGSALPEIKGLDLLDSGSD